MVLVVKIIRIPVIVRERDAELGEARYDWVKMFFDGLRERAQAVDVLLADERRRLVKDRVGAVVYSKVPDAQDAVPVGGEIDAIGRGQPAPVEALVEPGANPKMSARSLSAASLNSSSRANEMVKSAPVPLIKSYLSVDAS